MNIVDPCEIRATEAEVVYNNINTRSGSHDLGGRGCARARARARLQLPVQPAQPESPWEASQTLGKCN